MVAEDVLLIFTKYPEPGKVKTRLARAMGLEAAAQLYKLVAETLIFRLKAGQKTWDETVVFYEPPGKARATREWLGEGLSYLPQEGEDLGERLSNAVSASFKSGAKRVVTIGSDCLEVSGEVLHQAFQYLRHKDVVIGPAEDGGYYLIGLSREAPELFQAIDWGTEKVPLERIKHLGLSFATLKTLRDLDEPGDLSPILLHMLGKPVPREEHP